MAADTTRQQVLPKPTHTNPQTSGTLGKRQSNKKVLGGTEGLDEGTPACEDWKIQFGNTHTKESTPTPHRGCQPCLRAELEMKEQVASRLTSRGTQWTHFPRGPCRHLREQRGDVSGQSTGARAEGGQELTLQPCPPSGPGQNVLGWTCRDPPSLLRWQGLSWVGQGPSLSHVGVVPPSMARSD